MPGVRRREITLGTDRLATAIGLGGTRSQGRYHPIMDIVKRVLSVFLIATAVAVALNLILTPVYHDGSPEYPVWKILNWFMAAGVLVALVVSYMRKRALGGAGDDIAGIYKYVGVNAAYYGAIALTMLFFWEWFWTLNPDSETGEAVTSHMVYFPLVDALYTCVTFMIGGYLWNSTRGDD